jgi:tRNA splicing endonuclease
MSKCILRVAKINNHGSATGKTTHNYRLAPVPNADPERQHLNQEYINKGEKNIWELTNQRIEETGIKRVRKDAVRGMEFLITASPIAFKRDSAGIAQGDYRTSDWVKDNLNFLTQKYGHNVVAFTLHQDEKTPHIHAVVVPITGDGRLSAKEMFNPVSLKTLQTEYAQAMSKYGLERGIEGSRAQHQSMKQIYGLQEQTKQGLESDLTPLQAINQPLTLEKPGTLDLLNLERWRQQQQARINAEHTRQLEAVRKEAEKAQNMAIANATAAEQAKVLQQRLNTAEGLKQANHEKAQQLDEAKTKYQTNFEKLVILSDEGRTNQQTIHKLANDIRSKAMPRIEKDLLDSLKENLTRPQQVYERLTQKGYKVDTSKEYPTLIDPKTAMQLDLISTKVNGKSFAELLISRMEQSQHQEKKKGHNRGLGL